MSNFSKNVLFSQYPSSFVQALFDGEGFALMPHDIQTLDEIMLNTGDSLLTEIVYDDELESSHPIRFTDTEPSNTVHIESLLISYGLWNMLWSDNNEDTIIFATRDGVISAKTMLDWARSKDLTGQSSIKIDQTFYNAGQFHDRIVKTEFKNNGVPNASKLITYHFDQIEEVQALTNFPDSFDIEDTTVIVSPAFRVGSPATKLDDNFNVSYFTELVSSDQFTDISKNNTLVYFEDWVEYYASVSISSRLPDILFERDVIPYRFVDTIHACWNRGFGDGVSLSQKDELEDDIIEKAQDMEERIKKVHEDEQVTSSQTFTTLDMKAYFEKHGDDFFDTNEGQTFDVTKDAGEGVCLDTEQVQEYFDDDIDEEPVRDHPTYDEKEVASSQTFNMKRYFEQYAKYLDKIRTQDDDAYNPWAAENNLDEKQDHTEQRGNYQIAIDFENRLSKLESDIQEIKNMLSQQ